MSQKIFFYLLLLFSFACNNSNPLKNGKEKITVSKNKKELEKIISLKVFNPRSVEFVYKPMGTQTENDRVPGPTDYMLQAVLYFDITDNVHRQGCSPIEQSQSSRDDFNFEWLPDDVRKELLKDSDTTRGYQASCFYKGVLMHGSYYYLRGMILVLLFTN